MVTDLSPSNADSLLDYFRLWSTRCRLPLAVEATWLIVATMREDSQSPLYKCGESNPRITRAMVGESVALSYSQAICRFVNLLIDVVQKGAIAASMDSLASTVDIPSWIIQLRHNIAHGSSFPPLDVLRRAAVEMLEFYILPKYWIPQYSASLENASRGTEDGPGDGATDLSTLETASGSMGYDSIRDSVKYRAHSVCNRVWDHPPKHGSDSFHVLLSDSGIDVGNFTVGLELVRELFRQRNYDILKGMSDTGQLTRQMKLELVRLCSDRGDESEVLSFLKQITGAVSATSGKIEVASSDSYGMAFENDAFIF